MPNMKTKGQRNLKLLGGQEKTDGWPDGQADSSIPPLQLCCAGGIMTSYYTAEQFLNISEIRTQDSVESLAKDLLRNYEYLGFSKLIHTNRQ
jgi:hypothetical protein